MSDSPKPSAFAGISTPLAYSEALLPAFPSGMFFGAKDYNEDVARGKVSAARSRSIAELQRKKDQFGIALAGLRTADDYGLVRNAFEVLEEVAAAILKETQALARLSSNAEARYDEAHPIIEPAEAQPAAGVRIQINPTDINYPVNMAQAVALGAVKRGQLNGMINPALRMDRA